MTLNPTEPIKDPRCHPRQAEIIEAIKAGKRYREIQKEYGCSHIMIAYQKKKLGIVVKRERKKRERIKCERSESHSITIFKNRQRLEDSFNGAF